MHVHSQKKSFEDGGGSIREDGRRLKTSTCSSAKDSGPISRARCAFRSWYRCTSICGISNARDSSAAWESLLWIAVFLGAAVFTGVVGVFEQYLRYDVDTNVAVEYKDVAPFPAVSICNANRIHCGNIGKAIKKRKALVANSTFSSASEGCERHGIKYELDLLTYIEWMACMKSMELDEIFGEAGSTSGEAYCEGRWTNFSFKAEEVDLDREGNTTMFDPSGFSYFSDYFLDIYVSLQRSTRTEIGHQLYDLVRKCTFKSYNCRHDGAFSLWNLPLFGNCFTFNDYFNPADRRRGKRDISLTGSHYGLTMVLNLEREGYMFGGLTESVGARVSVFPPKVNVMPDESGFNVYPNTKTDVTLTHHLAERLPSPYTSHCVGSWDDTPFGGGRIANKSVYTLQQCQKLCVLQTLENSCNCVDVRLVDDVDFILDMRPDVRVCTTTPVPETSPRMPLYNCTADVFQGFDNGQYLCPMCRAPCREEAYYREVSSQFWPAIKYHDKAIHDYLGVDLSEALESDAAEVERLQNGLLKLGVYFRTLNTQALRETKRITASSLVSDLGGALSLMLGISIVMMLEFAQLAVRIVGAVLNFKTS